MARFKSNSRVVITNCTLTRALVQSIVSLVGWGQNFSAREFSTVAQSVFLIEKGEKKHPLQPVSVAGNFYKGLQKLIDIGNDSRKAPFSVETPTLIFDGFSVVG